MRVILSAFVWILSLGLFAQGTTISGTVSDANGEPLIGVTILVQGTTNGTVTNIDGEFQLSNVPSNADLEVSYVGMQTQIVPVDGQTTVNITLTEDTELLEELVVVGYGTMDRREVTSSIETVSAADFNQGGTRNAMDLIQGKVAGLNMTRTAGSNPNSGMEIQLRGVASLTGTRSPLIVIDGIPGGNLDLLQPDDIESFNILKDGSAAAIYGTRGNAGVILITTRKGRAGAPQFNYSSYAQHEILSERPKVFDAAGFRDLISQGIINESQDFGADTNLFDELINSNNLSHYHNFSASGGTENTNYRASVFYSNLEGIALENSREQFGGRINVNQRGLNDRLTMSVNLATNFNKANMLGGGTGDFEQAIQRNPTAPLYNEDGTFFETTAFNNYNPLSRLANRVSERNQQTTSADIRMQVDLTDYWSVSGFGSYQRNTYNDRYYRSSLDWDNRPGSSYQGMGYASKANHLSWSKTFEATTDYRRTFDDVHTLTGLLGYSYQYDTAEDFNVNNNGFTTDAFMDWNLGAGSAIQNTQLPRPGMGSNKQDNTLVAFFGRVNYSFDQRYYLQAIVRHEGSSRFGANHKWGTFPAISAGWTISEEDFMYDVDVIDELKLRVGYGVTGNQGIPNYQSLPTLSTGGVYPQDGVYYQTYGASRNPNPDLRWEQKHELNVGIDFDLLNRRLSGSIDVYNRNTRDLLYNYNAQQPPFVRDLIYTNVGSIRNSGIELQLSASAIRNQEFSWDIDLATSYQTNELTKLSSEVFQANWLSFYGLPSPGNLGEAFRLEEGGRVGNFYGKEFAGFTDDGKWLFYKADGTTARASDISEDDLKIIGNGVPKVQASLNNTFRYKNFDLTLLFRGKFGFDILNLKELYFGNTQWLPNNMLRTALSRHVELDDDPQYSDYYLERGDFVKLDNVTLGYNVPLNSDYISNLRFYVTGRNILTITGYSGVDPEVQDTGFEAGVDRRDYYPRTQSWTVGVNIGF